METDLAAKIKDLAEKGRQMQESADELRRREFAIVRNFLDQVRQALAGLEIEPFPVWEDVYGRGCYYFDPSTGEVLRSSSSWARNASERTRDIIEGRTTVEAVTLEKMASDLSIHYFHPEHDLIEKIVDGLRKAVRTPVPA